MVEKPPHHTYDIYLEVEAHGGIWRPFYLSYIYIYISSYTEFQKMVKFLFVYTIHFGQQRSSH